MICALHLQNEDLNKPLLEILDDHSSQSNTFPGNVVGESSKVQTSRSDTSPRSHGISDSGRTYPADSCTPQGMYNDAQTFSSLLT
jgi:protein phosphatase